MQKEKELKYELTFSAHQRIRELARPFGQPERFTNLYYRAAEPVERRDWVLRLRRWEGGGGELTLKIGRETSPGMFCSTEYTCAVESDDPAKWTQAEPYRVFCQEISTLAPELQGVSLNQRWRLWAPFGPVTTWELDQTKLPDGTCFYELEIEWEPKAEPSTEEIERFRLELEGWMLAHDMGAPRPSRVTKYRRFLDSLATA